jgi:hypothetical protein
MKNLCIIAVFCTSVFAHAVTKNDLEKAIRSFDVESVKQIIIIEKFSPREYIRYLALAEEVVRNRELWILKSNSLCDGITPYDAPSRGWMLTEYIAGLIGCAMCGPYLLDDPECSNRTKKLLLAGVIFGVTMLGKCVYDFRRLLIADEEYKETLRKKYDDAITIKQLMYTADVVEA